jgi:hypothetical protein
MIEVRKHVVRALVLYEIHEDMYVLRLYYSDNTTELFALREEVRNQLKGDGIPKDHCEWLKAFKAASA